MAERATQPRPGVGKLKDPHRGGTLPPALLTLF
jgi:hypothetical protein